ncbi:MAG TPA: RNA polymerase sigma factor [Candidatus Angelobacter sp.]|nr:RNA polymerase sigma factor [Candidatus Angelobacter sp.]
MTVHAICGETVLKQDEVIEAGAPAETVEILVAHHAAMVFRIANSILRNHHDAEDSAQECFLRVLKLQNRLAAVRNLKTWLARVAWTTALDRRRHVRTACGDDREMLDSLPDPAVAVDEQVAGREMQRLLQRLVASLPRDLRETLELSTVQELNSSEIAEIMQIPESSVRTRLFRARKILKEKLAAREVKNHD